MLLRSSKPEGVVNAFRVGARGVFLSRPLVEGAFENASEWSNKGQIWASNEDLGHLIKALARSKPPQFNDPDGMPLLTSREKEVVQFVVDGLKNREIAEKLNVKEHSVRNYLYRSFEKLGISTRVELLLYYFSRGKAD